jgi:hypothetical protein
MIEEQIRPLDPAVEPLCTVIGIQHRGAQCIIGEIGTDMTRFATARYLASWAGSARATTNQPASAAPAGPATDPSGWK